ncbi:ATP-NAD kinase-like domain-containing protein [Hysterangium stoloniferum]|nr:ATP-NAD kinase-like domain-containing protein [Hysterangium stoloniferum]
MKAAYDGCQLRRKFKVVINPCGGSGKAQSVFDKKVKPIFEAANTTLDVMVTAYNGHCYEYMKSMPLEYDAIVVLSGDGLVHETFNAFADRVDSKAAFATPVVQIPTGSGNGFSIALLGLKDGLDVSAAALNAIKGKQMKLDLCSVLQNGKRSISFMSQAIGLMADVDLGTEKLRWMGDARFMLGFIWHVGMNRRCPMKLEMKVVARDKRQMVRTYRSTRSLAGFSETQSEDTHHKSSLPETENTEEEADEWTVIDRDLSYIYAGKLPYVSRDLMQFPLALCDDGLIDIVVQERASRMVFLKGLDRADRGKQYWEPTQLYFKAKAYRLTPHATEGHLSLDGERYPYTPFEVEVQQSLGTTLGKGSWNVEFNE